MSVPGAWPSRPHVCQQPGGQTVAAFSSEVDGAILILSMCQRRPHRRHIRAPSLCTPPPDKLHQGSLCALGPGSAPTGGGLGLKLWVVSSAAVVARTSHVPFFPGGDPREQAPHHLSEVPREPAAAQEGARTSVPSDCTLSSSGSSLLPARGHLPNKGVALRSLSRGLLLGEDIQERKQRLRVGAGGSASAPEGGALEVRDGGQCRQALAIGSPLHRG